MSAAEQERCTDDDDDEFDALISAVVARAAQRCLTDPIPLGQAWLAMREGWIHLPLRDSLHQLAGQARPQP
jgi:hypothetical protein